jgi:hypothetical protein
MEISNASRHPVKPCDPFTLNQPTAGVPDCQSQTTASSTPDSVSALASVRAAAELIDVPGAAAAAPVAAAAATSLDTRESSVNFFPTNVPSGDAPPLNMAQAFIHSGWEWLRNRVRRALYQTEQSPSRITAFDNCCNEMTLHRDHDDHSKLKLLTNRCHDRLCLPCAAVRSFQLRDALLAQIQGKPHTFITLTLSGKGETLVALIDRLYRHFRALRQHPTWADRVSGGAAFLEVKWNAKAGRWHPHLHIVCDSKYLPQADLSDAWRSISHDSFIVDIRKIRDDRVAAGYVTKYASKPLNMTFARDPSKLQEAVIALKGRRLCLTFGTWYGTPLTNAEDKELTEDERLDEAYRWECLGRVDDLARLPHRDAPHVVTWLHLVGLRLQPDATAPPT